MSIYLVTGKRHYQGFQPGEQFEADLDRLVEARAIRRGNIAVLDRSKPQLQPGSFKLPKANG